MTRMKGFPAKSLVLQLDGQPFMHVLHFRSYIVIIPLTAVDRSMWSIFFGLVIHLTNGNENYKAWNGKRLFTRLGWRGLMITSAPAATALPNPVVLFITTDIRLVRWRRRTVHFEGGAFPISYVRQLTRGSSRAHPWWRVLELRLSPGTTVLYYVSSHFSISFLQASAFQSLPYQILATGTVKAGALVLHLIAAVTIWGSSIHICTVCSTAVFEMKQSWTP